MDRKGKREAFVGSIMKGKLKKKKRKRVGPEREREIIELRRR